MQVWKHPTSQDESGTARLSLWQVIFWRWKHKKKRFRRKKFLLSGALYLHFWLGAVSDIRWNPGIICLLTLFHFFCPWSCSILPHSSISSPVNSSVNGPETSPFSDLYYVSDFSWSASSACLPIFSLLCKCRCDWTAVWVGDIYWIGSKNCSSFQVRCSRWRYGDHRVQTPHVKLSAFEFHFSLGVLSQQTARSSAHPETLLHACIFITSEAKGSEHADSAANSVTLSADLVAFQDPSAWLNCQKRLATKLAPFSGLRNLVLTPTGFSDKVMWTARSQFMSWMRSGGVSPVSKHCGRSVSPRSSTAQELRFCQMLRKRLNIWMSKLFYILRSDVTCGVHISRPQARRKEEAAGENCDNLATARLCANDKLLNVFAGAESARGH